MKKIGKIILTYGQVIVAFFIVEYLRFRGLDISRVNDLGLILAITSTYSIIAGFLNRYSDDWAGFASIALMIYGLIITLKAKYLLVGLPASILLICVFYFPSGMNMERIKENREKEKNKTEN